MANPTLAEQFQIRPVPKKKKNGKTPGEPASVKAARALHSCKPGMICIYVIGPDDDRLSKVGVSTRPYLRMEEMCAESSLNLRMCYFAEVERAKGYLVERRFHDACKAAGEQVDGEWVSAPRLGITKRLRGIMAEHGITPTKEVGDTGEIGEDDEASPISSTWAANLVLFKAGWRKKTLDK